jgi:hypothetical protein
LKGIGRSPHLNVEVLHFECVLFDELPPRLNGITHENRKNFSGLYGVFDLNLKESSSLGIHGGFPQLFGVHFTETLITLYMQVLLAKLHHVVDQFPTIF